MTSFFSRKTLKQLVLYFLVGVYEYAVGYELFRHIHLASWIAFGVQSIAVGFTAFLMRKFFVFQEEKPA